MYLQNKYTTWYYNIINKAKNRTIAGYTEKHHIIPRSLGGNNSKSNIVNLTAREHFVCHLLLTKMTIGNNMYKMKFALSMITKIKNIGGGRYTPSSRLYEYAKKSYKESLIYFWTDERRKAHSIKNKKTSTGRKHSIETIEKMKNKVWTEKAIQNRLKNCLSSAAQRKGIKNPNHGETIFKNYVNNNIDIIRKIWELHENGKNRRKISIELGISWDRANIAINKKLKITNLLENQNY